MFFRTDLALDSFEAFRDISDGIKKTDYTHLSFRVTDIEVLDEEAALKLNKRIGRYLTIEIPSPINHPENNSEIEKLLAKELATFLISGETMIIGLGNVEVPADALGPFSARKIFVTRHIPKEMAKNMGLSSLRSVSSVAVGVLGKTGVESEETAHALTKVINPQNIIVIDALAASSIHRLGTAIQITNTGISPGSGVGGTSKEISSETMNGLNVISIGVPMVVDASVIASESGGNGENLKGLIVTTKDADRLNETLSEIISSAINLALFPEIDRETLKQLVI